MYTFCSTNTRTRLLYSVQYIDQSKENCLLRDHLSAGGGVAVDGVGNREEEAGGGGRGERERQIQFGISIG